MSQTSMRIKQIRAGRSVDHDGFLPCISDYSNTEFLTTTGLIHYKYSDLDGFHELSEITLAILPNGKLQEIYNPSSDETIWLAGRNAPTLGEDFRVRLNFSALSSKKAWRVQKIIYDTENQACSSEWTE